MQCGTQIANSWSRWKKDTCVFRTKWNVHNVPTLVRFEVVDEAVKETGRLIEDEILDGKMLQELVSVKA
jgi:hypothetical protein